VEIGQERQGSKPRLGALSKGKAIPRGQKILEPPMVSVKQNARQGAAKVA